MSKYAVIYCDKAGPYSTRHLSIKSIEQNFKKKTTGGTGVAWGKNDQDIMFFIFDNSVVFDQLSPIIHSVIDNIDGRPHWGFTAKMKDGGKLND
jgi:hypothetical protein